MNYNVFRVPTQVGLPSGIPTISMEEVDDKHFPLCPEAAEWHAYLEQKQTFSQSCQKGCQNQGRLHSQPL